MRVFRYQLPLHSPIQIGRQILEHREGLLLENQGRWAEASPLPGFSRERLSDVIASLSQAGEIDSPSLDFGRSSLEREWTACSIPLSALLSGTPVEIVDKVMRLACSGCRAVKLKLGRSKTLETDIELTGCVRNLLGSEQRLRLDANRAWSFDEAVRFAQGIADVDVEYIEEPLRDPERLEELLRATDLPYALDETLAERASLEDFPNATALIVKPTILGGCQRIEQLVTSHKPLVFSACFESGVGIARIAQLAAEYSPDCVAGLDTYSCLASDVLEDGLTVRDWELHVPEHIVLRQQSLQELRW